MFQGYIFRRTVEGIHIIHLGKTWEKLMVAARMQLGNSEHVSISCVFFLGLTGDPHGHRHPF
jgi:ribosomal protein S2